ncbi:MAG: uroporphyrinogen-III synthase [Candidatus Calescibacterium sp.]|nr:uroporphyrinogen-III synthase [Candidatus Calescibacterium sp.]MDW8132063.1 uroporphyrinogen-III synthase [Candidatus Calescibacterium sp.]
MRVLITRPKCDDNKFLKDLLEKEFGISIDIIEIAKIRPIYRNLKKAIDILDNFDYVGWTSQNGVELFYQYLKKNKKEYYIDKIRDKGIIAIGPRTAEKIEVLFSVNKNIIIPPKYESRFLEFLLDELGRKCLILRSSLAKPIRLPNVQELHIYTLYPNREIFGSSVNYDYVVLTSSFLTKIFFKFFKVFPNLGFIPIGPSTYDELVKHVDKSKIIDYPSSFTIKDALKKILS